ncbi:hypothetical protein BAUCODRAFT_451341 [Baudoinia panamericana UAMH 10762]|uniref:RRM domain-containing protein n=1 Tax=Baudoinia panamericana (strain UAMH 10762) TaxID=717646 RepID=M2LSF1_BAUPA|nr:uncharacterized protein BAUCODRAFT_451341 [Baudoinia panamericana UAMH 10762]EMC97402.1 hypothetical protein BAUCODRAFT_451341 [Baudoinia panamericana UAMH 10762]
MKQTAPPDGHRRDYYICFDDLRDTSHAQDAAQSAQLGGPINFISQPEYAAVPDGAVAQNKSSFFDGQVKFLVSFTGKTPDYDGEKACKVVKGEAEKFGELLAFKQEEVAAWPNLEFRAEYFKVTDARKALREASKDGPLIVGKWVIVAEEIQLLEHKKPTAKGFIFGDPAKVKASEYTVLAVRTPPTEDQAGEWVSPTGRTTAYYDENGEMAPGKPAVIVPKVGNGQAVLISPAGVNTPERGQRWFSAPSPHTPSPYVALEPRSDSWDGRVEYYQRTPHSDTISGPTAVDLVKIEKGYDVRTTVMLRNVPNKMQARDLKRIMDTVSFGKYDFSYLRIDFSKNTNVGYAFVNFEDPADIIPFVQHWRGRRWIENHPRTADMSYATIQGLDCLIDKFRNSSVIVESPDHRPKLWFTARTASADKPEDIGTEMEFPPVDNPSKMQRSMENARHVGLYQPQSGHGSRERSRGSQFDRGTPAQMREEAYNNTSPLHQGYQYNNSYAHNGFQDPAYTMAPPQFFPNGYPMGYNQNMIAPYYNGVNMQAPAYYPNGWSMEPFAAAYQQGQQHGHHNGFKAPRFVQGANPTFGMGPGTPASRRRNVSNGRLGGRPRLTIAAAGSAQGPTGGPQLQILTEEDIEGGYNNTPGPHYYPKYK